MYLLLMGEDGRKYIVQAKKGMQRVQGLGVINTDVFDEDAVGKQLEFFGEKYLVLKPEPEDYIDLIKRKTQIILPKDTGYIITRCGILPGKRIIEIGCGVGGLTIFLASIVGKSGHVFAYERRKEHISECMRNIDIMGLREIVEFFERDAADGLLQTDVDAVICDIPEPWSLARNIRDALRLGGWCACYLPTYNQVEKTYLALTKEGFGEVECVELLLRRIVVAENAVRPDFSMLGHTGFIVFGRRIR
ncbi:MAG: tRNA (adenine-N1)-methyltransferase [Thermoplasmata archaeon]